jgi:hypothetical protein
VVWLDLRKIARHGALQSDSRPFQPWLLPSSPDLASMESPWQLQLPDGWPRRHVSLIPRYRPDPVRLIIGPTSPSYWTCRGQLIKREGKLP